MDPDDERELRRRYDDMISGRSKGIRIEDYIRELEAAMSPSERAEFERKRLEMRARLRGCKGNA